MSAVYTDPANSGLTQQAAPDPFAVGGRGMGYPFFRIKPSFVDLCVPQNRRLITRLHSMLSVLHVDDPLTPKLCRVLSRAIQRDERRYQAWISA